MSQSLKTSTTPVQPELYLLDTDICSYLMERRHSRVEERAQQIGTERIAASAVTYAEISYGLALRNVGLKRTLAARRFFDSIEILDWTESAADAYGRPRAALQRAGSPIGDHDVMIAAHAIVLDAVLVTNNTRHFERLGAPLRLENCAE